MFHSKLSLFQTLILVGVMTACSFECSNSLPAQTAGRSKHWLSMDLADEVLRSTLTKAGGQVVSFPCDPLMSAKTERELTEALQKECESSLTAEITVSQLATELSAHIPVVLDRRALAEIGVDPDRAVRDAATIFGGRVESSSDRSVKPSKWWKRDAQPQRQRRPSVLVAAMTHLRDADLTLMIRRGQVLITTLEAAENDLATRIYDVTPMAVRQEFSSRSRSVSAERRHDPVADLSPLMETIETAVDSETWEALGGPSTIIPAAIRNRHWLVISTTTMTHWKIQRLLDRLNQ